MHSAGGLGEDTLARSDDHLLTLLLAASPRFTADLVARRLRAPADMTPGAQERAIATLQAWLDAHGDVSAVAKMLQVHPQTVRYRLSGLRGVLGDGALDDPKARLEVALALHAATAFNARFRPEPAATPPRRTGRMPPTVPRPEANSARS